MIKNTFKSMSLFSFIITSLTNFIIKQIIYTKKTLSNTGLNHDFSYYLSHKLILISSIIYYISDNKTSDKNPKYILSKGGNHETNLLS
jgi:hypothetical protein